MTISGISGNTNISVAGMGNSNVDAYSKSLQKQIADAQKQLQELSQDDQMDSDAKMMKRQEIQKQISSLNMQLRQHMMEERTKAQQENQAEQSAGRGRGMSKNSMEAVLSADLSLRQAQAQGSTVNRMQNDARIKRTEIRLDGGSSKRSSDDNASVSGKWDEVERMEQHAEMAAAEQMSLLAGVQDKLNEAAAADSTSVKKQEKTEAEGAEKADAGETEKTAGAEKAAAGETEKTAGAEKADAAEPALVSVSESAGKLQNQKAAGSSIDVKI